MSLLRCHLQRLLRLPRVRSLVQVSSNIQTCSYGGDNRSCSSRVVPLCLSWRPVSCRYYCVKAQTKENQSPSDIEGSISVDEAGQIALNTLLRNMAMPELLKQLKLVLKRGLKQDYKKMGDTFKFSEAFFQRITELVSENPDLKEKRTRELLADPAFQEIIDLVEENRASPLLVSLLSCLFNLTTEELPQMIDIEKKILTKLQSYFNLPRRKRIFLKAILDFYEHHQETELRQEIYKTAQREMEKMLTGENGRQVLSFFDIDPREGNSPALQELQGQALMNANKLGFNEITHILSLLGATKIRNMPVIEVLVHRLKTSDPHYSVKALKRLLFALSELSIYDEGLMKVLNKNLREALAFIIKEKDKVHMFPILKACARLHWKCNEIIAPLVHEILESLSTGALGIEQLPSVIYSLALLNWAENDTIIDAVIETQSFLQEDPEQWLNIVWWLVVLEKRLAEVVPGVLTEDFCLTLEQLVTDKPEYVRRSVHTRLLNIVGCSNLELGSPVKPANYDVWMDSYREAVPNRTNFFKKKVGETLESLKPESVTTNTVVDYGYVLDFEFQMKGKDSSGNEKLYRYGVKLLDFKDMLRTPDRPEPHGQSALCIRHLHKMGYNLITVPYYEWNDQASAEQKEQYLRDKIEAAQIEAWI